MAGEPGSGTRPDGGASTGTRARSSPAAETASSLEVTEVTEAPSGKEPAIAERTAADLLPGLLDEHDDDGAGWQARWLDRSIFDRTVAPNVRRRTGRRAPAASRPRRFAPPHGQGGPTARATRIRSWPVPARGAPRAPCVRWQRHGAPPTRAPGRVTSTRLRIERSAGPPRPVDEPRSGPNVRGMHIWQPRDGDAWGGRGTATRGQPGSGPNVRGMHIWQPRDGDGARVDRTRGPLAVSRIERLYEP